MLNIRINCLTFEQAKKTTKKKGFKAISMEQITVRMRKKVKCEPNKHIYIKNVAYIDAKQALKEKVEQMPLHQITERDGEYIVLEEFILRSILNKHFPNVTLDFVGPSETIVKIEKKKQHPSIFLMLIVWIVLFIGTAMTIMNFHYDVSMPEVHQKLHYIFTGEQKERPLWIQIPYSIGLGVGMILFLNHWFKKRINEEPSPLEIELFKYEQDIEQYIRHYENDLNDEKRHF